MLLVISPVDIAVKILYDTSEHLATIIQYNTVHSLVRIDTLPFSTVHLVTFTHFLVDTSSKYFTTFDTDT